MADIGKAYLQIIPKAEGITGQLGQLIDAPSKAAGEKGGKDAGQGIASGIGKALAGLAIGGTITAGLKTAMDEGAKLQQSFGGLDTIYGDASGKAKEFAAQAAQAGISANDYAEQAVSFGASLKQAFEGDTSKAVEAANTAIMDMTDNAAKMGTPIENIQNAYQGFAKGNYTMLDNLKLGYGGTKTEMERLLADASKLSGVEYNIDNLGDVYDAIHVIQGDLGLTGVAAAEASETFSGSLDAMKASAANLFGALSTGGDVQGAMSTLLTSAGTFFFDNFLPMLGEILSAIPGALSTAISTAAPMLSEKVPELLTALGTAITTYAPQLLTKGVELVTNLANGVLQSIPALVSKVQELFAAFLGAITANLPTVLAKGFEIVTNIAQGILNNIPAVIAGAGNMIAQFIAFLTANLPTIAAKGGEFLKTMATRIITAIPSVIAAVAKLIPKIVTALARLVPVALKAAWEMIKSLAQGIRQGFGNISPAIKTLIQKITKPMQDMIGKVKDIMGRVMDALVTKWNSIKSKAQSVWDGIKNAISKPIEKAKELVSNAVSRIKGIFPISMGKIFSGVKLPHFKISGGSAPWGIGGQGTKPSVGIDWYARGGIAKAPSLIGIGEAGNEAIVPLSDPYMKPFAKAVASQMSGGNNITNYIQIDGARDPQLVVDELLRQMNMRVRTA